jgi:hypothetical protein
MLENRMLRRISRRMRFGGHVARMVEASGAYII